MNPRRALIMTMAIAAAGSALAVEQVWPHKPVRIIVSGTPGTVPDLVARWLAERLSPLLGQPIIIDNRPGAGGSLAAEAAAHSAPDGYTLALLTQGAMTINPHLYKHLGYDPLTDFAPITRIVHGSLVLAVGLNVPATSIAELVRLAKARPGALSYGSPGIGTPPHLASELFVRAAGIEATHVPYKGGQGLTNDLLAGRLTWSIESGSVHVPMAKGGRVRALAVTGKERTSALPDVPTFAESGLPGFEYRGWIGIAAPVATPKAVIERLYAQIAKVLATPEAHEWFESAGSNAGGEPPQIFATSIRDEHAKWRKVIRDSGIKIE